jgi:hypothetical protein
MPPSACPNARYSVTTPASATLVYLSRLALDSRPVCTSPTNAPSQNVVPACTLMMMMMMMMMDVAFVFDCARRAAPEHYQQVAGYKWGPSGSGLVGPQPGCRQPTAVGGAVIIN